MVSTWLSSSFTNLLPILTLSISSYCTIKWKDKMIWRISSTMQTTLSKRTGILLIHKAIILDVYWEMQSWLLWRGSLYGCVVHGCLQDIRFQQFDTFCHQCYWDSLLFCRQTNRSKSSLLSVFQCLIQDQWFSINIWFSLAKFGDKRVKKKKLYVYSLASSQNLVDLLHDPKVRQPVSSFYQS